MKEGWDQVIRNFKIRVRVLTVFARKSRFLGRESERLRDGQSLRQSGPQQGCVYEKQYSVAV